MHGSVQEQISEAYASLMAAAPEERSTAYGHLGTLLMAGEYLAEAERCFRHARLLALDDFRWPYYLGHIYKNTGRLTKAVEHFEYVLRLRPDHLATLVWLGHVHIDEGRPEAAEPLLTKARSLHPDTQAVLFQLGRAAVATRDYARAVEHLEGALKMDPAATMVRYPLAMAYRGLGDLERAQYYLGQSGGRAGAGVGVTLPDPLMSAVITVLRSPQAYWDLGLYAGAQGNWSEAVKQFRLSVQLAPDDPIVRLNLALALDRLGDARAALDQLEETVRLDPRLARAHFATGTLLERSGRDGEAIDRYTLAVTHDPNLGDAHLRLADALRRTDRPDASLSSYQRVLELAPDRAEARFGEVMALVRLTRHREALERLRVAMELHPEESAFPLALARLLAASPDAQIRDGQEALALVSAVAAEHATTVVAETMAMALAERGHFAEAVEWQGVAMSGATAAGYSEVAQRMAANLALYELHKPCRTPWRDDAPEHRPGPTVEPGLLGPPAAKD
jgi:tetratricopeptide (TPR) repeat protein